MRRATLQQLESALETLALITESDDVEGQERDDIANVRSTLWRLVDDRERARPHAGGLNRPGSAQ